MRSGWKRLAEWALVRSGLPAHLQARRPRSTVIIAYHNIVPRGERAVGDLSLHVDQDVFSEQLSVLMDSHDVVGLETLGSGHEPPGSRPIAVITFDDAYLGAMTAGIEELSKRTLPATVFVAPGLLGAEGFWWDLYHPSNDRSAAGAIRRHALRALQGRQHAVLDWATQEGLARNVLPPHAKPATRDTFLHQAERSTVTLGAHTWSHPNLTRLNSEECTEELGRAPRWLQQTTNRAIDWLAYPYGMRTARVVHAARDLFEGGLLVTGGAFATGALDSLDMLQLPRLNISRGVSADGFRLRLSGFVG